MLRRVNESNINLEKSYFHFTNLDNVDRIEKNNLLPKVGENASMIEETEKIFFSIGASGILKLQDVWLKWMMNRMFGESNLKKKYDDDRYNAKLHAWIQEFLTKEYKKDEEKKNMLFTKYYHDMLENVYLVLNLTNGYDYDKNDYDEVKLRLNKDTSSIDYLLMKEMYGEYSNVSNTDMEGWNMHTIRKRYVKSRFIRVVTYKDKDINVIEMLKLIYEKYKDTRYDLLDDFMLWLKMHEEK